MQALIAEDDLTSRTMLQAVLNKWGYETVCVTDGDEAYAAMQEENAPQLLILDWMMPSMDGPELCRQLRGHERADPLYIILLSSKSERQDVIVGLETGADDYITKPYDNNELRARVNVGKRMLELQARLREKEKLQGVLEMAGAVCHEINQPLQAVNGYAELLLMNVSENDRSYRMLRNIKEGVERIGQLTRKIMGISRYRTKEYMNGQCAIVDIEDAAMTPPGTALPAQVQPNS